MEDTKHSVGFPIPEEDIVYDDGLYTVTEKRMIDGESLFTIYNRMWEFVDEFTDLTLTEEEKNDFTSSYAYQLYLDAIDAYETGEARSFGPDRFSDWIYGFDKFEKSKKEKTPEEIEEEKKLVEELCKSDTIVFHQTDTTTVMLDPIYAGKGFDVYKESAYSGTLSRDSIHELIKRHQRVVCLGHGTPRGLLSGIIGEEEVPFLKDKKIFSMWCYAATFWKDNGFEGHGILTSDNFPSEVWECKSACNATVSSEWIYDNMMLAGEIAGKAMDIGWDNPQAGCDYFRKEYSEKSKVTTDDEKKVVEFNTNSMQVV